LGRRAAGEALPPPNARPGSKNTRASRRSEDQYGVGIKTRDPGTFDKSLTYVRFPVVRFGTCRISRYPGVLCQIPQGIFLRKDVPLDIRALRLRHEQSVKEIGSGSQRVHALSVMEEIPGHRLADSHADGKQREAKKADEA
jgi:hypothetical protein